jgi:hypothetical protein
MKAKIIEIKQEGVNSEIASKRRIGTVFPLENCIVNGFGAHGTVMCNYLMQLDSQRQKENREKLSDDEKERLLENLVDIIYEQDNVFIRPNPERMDLALIADDMLQESIPKHKIRFLYASDNNVRKALVERGECYRLACKPKTEEEILELIQNSRTAITDREMYYYNKESGTRYLTFEEFSELEKLDSPNLAIYLEEIAEYSNRRNMAVNPELTFFKANEELFSKKDFKKKYTDLNSEELKKEYLKLKNKFEKAVEAKFRKKDLESIEWVEAISENLMNNGKKDFYEEDEAKKVGLAPEYGHRVQWLPGARIKAKELIYDTICSEKKDNTNNKYLESICNEDNPIVNGIIFNHFRENPKLKSINVGVIPESLSKRKGNLGRRGVYIVEIENLDSITPIIKLIRMQKYDVRGLLKKGMSPAEAQLRASKITDYTLNRNFACRKIGMNLFKGTLKNAKVSEIVDNQEIFSTYYERDYVFGIATDKINSADYHRRINGREFYLELANLLGEAAAPNMILGRIDNGKEENKIPKVLFDDGDEVLIKDNLDMPKEIIIADFTGSFKDCETELEEFAPHYAAPIINKAAHVPSAALFAENYIGGFIRKFKSIQKNYIKDKPSFDNLFNIKNENPADEFDITYKWRKTLERMANSDPVYLGKCIRDCILI